MLVKYEIMTFVPTTLIANDFSQTNHRQPYDIQEQRMVITNLSPMYNIVPNSRLDQTQKCQAVLKSGMADS